MCLWIAHCLSPNISSILILFQPCCLLYIYKILMRLKIFEWSLWIILCCSHRNYFMIRTYDNNHKPVWRRSAPPILPISRLHIGVNLCVLQLCFTGHIWDLNIAASLSQVWLHCVKYQLQSEMRTSVYSEQWWRWLASSESHNNIFLRIENDSFSKCVLEFVKTKSEVA